MCDISCINERNEIYNILQEFTCLNDIIDEIKEDYNNKEFIGKITTLIAKSNEFIYYGGPPKYQQINEKIIVDGNYTVLNNFKKPEIIPNPHYNAWLNCKKENEKMPELIKSHCLCFHHIKNLCFIKNIKTEKIYTIGIECINKFTNNRRTCGICNNPHRNSKDNHCKDCRIKIKEELKLKKEEENKKKYDEKQKRQNEMANFIYFKSYNICKFGKYNGEEFEIVFKDKSYIRWVLKNLDMDNKNNLYYLIKLYKERISI